MTHKHTYSLNNKYPHMVICTHVLGNIQANTHSNTHIHTRVNMETDVVLIIPL